MTTRHGLGFMIFRAPLKLGTAVIKASQLEPLKGFPKKLMKKNRPVKTVSEATVDLGHVVKRLRKVKKKVKVISEGSG